MILGMWFVRKNHVLSRLFQNHVRTLLAIFFPYSSMEKLSHLANFILAAERKVNEIALQISLKQKLDIVRSTDLSILPASKLVDCDLLREATALKGLVVKWVRRDGTSLRPQNQTKGSSVSYSELGSLMMVSDFDTTPRACSEGYHVVPVECAVGYALHTMILPHCANNLALAFIQIPSKIGQISNHIVKTVYSYGVKIRCAAVVPLALVNFEGFPEISSYSTLTQEFSFERDPLNEYWEYCCGSWDHIFLNEPVALERKAITWNYSLSCQVSRMLIAPYQVQFGTLSTRTEGKRSVYEARMYLIALKKVQEQVPLVSLNKEKKSAKKKHILDSQIRNKDFDFHTQILQQIGVEKESHNLERWTVIRKMVYTQNFFPLFKYYSQHVQSLRNSLTNSTTKKLSMDLFKNESGKYSAVLMYKYISRLNEEEGRLWDRFAKDYAKGRDMCVE